MLTDVYNGLGINRPEQEWYRRGRRPFARPYRRNIFPEEKEEETSEEEEEEEEEIEGIEISQMKEDFSRMNPAFLGQSVNRAWKYVEKKLKGDGRVRQENDRYWRRRFH